MDNILSLLNNYTLDNADDIAKALADDFRKRRIEKNLTREQVAEKSGVALSNIIRFEQKGLISLKNLICLAMLCLIIRKDTFDFQNIIKQEKAAAKVLRKQKKQQKAAA